MPNFAVNKDNSTLGNNYKFSSFSDGEDQYDYNAILNNSVEYKGNTFFTFWQYTALAEYHCVAI